ncbi:MAG: hypothetical protein NMK33_05715 [Candidatus Cardinium sp.]|uniref:hypothetical protein n=1 Tax=Cardinium endosymbiont of Dermatophagoides farinae TaxID=2597823 RepID=UPI001183F586|nr:hypothetical protein [Cardinium endosymbiont of Dermatophagoides farinae]TSJ80902.1 hypothetical protein FPG78_02510 [Cardinium endosymbiont of Dermatophagoides farinae]UWW96914.1 MAG: hypothetical protein NMK33_05715 [Candidatus Cardinium sp.]
MNTPEISPFIKRLLEGVNKANYKMVKAAAAENRSLVLGDDKGKVIIRPAIEVLKELDEKYNRTEETT